MRSLHPLALPLSLLLTLGTPLAAQQDSIVRLPEVVITATRLTTDRDAVPATVTVLDGAELRARGIRFVSAALRDVPGLSVVQTGSFGGQTALFIRGGESDYVKVLIDGVPVNEPGGAIDLAHLTTENVERIEIVRGPSSVLYGSDAVSGVVQIFTERGRGDTRASAGLAGGTYGTLDADLAVRGGSERVSHSLAVSRSITDGIYPFNNRYRNVVGSASVEARPDDRTVARLAVRYEDAVLHIPTDGTGDVVDENAFRATERTVASLDIGRFLTSALELRGLLTINQADATNDDQPDDAADTLGFFASRDVQAVTRRSADVRLNAHLSPNAVLTGGMTLEEQEERRFGSSESQFGGSSSTSAADRRTWAYYAQVQAKLVDGMGATAGVRVDDNDAFGTFLTGRGGVTYDFAGHTRLRASVGTAFKEPSFFENFSNSPFARGNPDLDPERTLSWEAGVEQRLAAERLWVAATYFAQRFRDLIQFTFMPANPEDPNYFNVAKANAFGGEVELRAVIVPGLSLAASYTRTATRVVDAGLDTDGLQFVTDSSLLRRPEHQARVDLTYGMPGSGHVGVAVQWVGERADRDFSAFPATHVVLPAYATVDVSAAVVVLRRGNGRPEIGLNARATNLLDERYQAVFGFASPGRTILVGGTVTY